MTTQKTQETTQTITKNINKFNNSFSQNDNGRLIGNLIKIAPEKQNSDIYNVALATENPYTGTEMHFLKASGDEADKLLHAKKNDMIDLSYKVVSKIVDKQNLVSLNVVTCEVIG